MSKQPRNVNEALQFGRKNTTIFSLLVCHATKLSDDCSLLVKAHSLLNSRVLPLSQTSVRLQLPFSSTMASLGLFTSLS